MFTVTAIVPTAGEQNMHLLEKCILSLVKAAQKNVQLKIVVNTELPIKKFPKFWKHVSHTQTAIYRSGYSLRHNNAIGYALKNYSSDYLLLINDDAWVLPDFFA